MSNMNYSKIEQILSNMELKDISKKDSQSFKVYGEDDNYRATIVSRKFDDRIIYSVKIISNNPLEDVGDLFYEHSFSGPSNGDAYALIYYAKYADVAIKNRVLAPLQKTGTSTEYGSK